MEKDLLKILVHDDIRFLRSIGNMLGLGIGGISSTRIVVRQNAENILRHLRPSGSTDTETVLALYYALVRSAANLHADNDNISAQIIIENIETAVQRYLKE